MEQANNYAFAKAQAQSQLKPVTIKELVNEPDTYANYPPYQRRAVWPVKLQQWLINDILLGRSIPSEIAYKRMDPYGKQTYWFADGNQRNSAIYNFHGDKFKTWTIAQKEQAMPNSRPPVEPGKKFSELSTFAKNIFLDYVLYINVEQEVSDEEQRERFRSFQNHVPLTGAEKIDSYVSKAKDAALLIETHPFWEDFYMGKEREKKSKKIFQSSLYLLALDLSSDGLANLTEGNFIHALASGKRDKEITDSVVDNVIARLDLVSHLFSSTEFTTRAACVPMYQSVIFLEQAGYTIQSSDKGKLTNWIKGVISESNRAQGVIGYQRPLQQLTRRPIQRLFWERHLKTVLALCGVSQNEVGKPVELSERTRSDYDRITSVVGM